MLVRMNEAIDFTIMNTLRDEWKTPPVIYGKSVVIGKQVEY